MSSKLFGIFVSALQHFTIFRILWRIVWSTLYSMLSAVNTSIPDSSYGPRNSLPCCIRMKYIFTVVRPLQTIADEKGQKVPTTFTFSS